MNCSIEKGVCPDGSKLARVIPIYKEKGHNYLYTNYRPISLIPVMSKIMEKLIYNKITEFLMRYNIIYKSQYGFRRGHNTTHAILDFLKTVESSLDKNEYSIGVLCDLSKAFDTLDHGILTDKLYHYGIRGNINKWLISYLTNRKQFADLDGILSSTAPLLAGVPQGSILGPLLFLLYVNDLPASVEKMRPIMFADDTNLVINGPSLNDLKITAQNELEGLLDYFRANHLKLNVDKTKIICFHKRGVAIPDSFSITMDNIDILPVDSASFLGITIDNTLSWEKHCHSVSNKISKSAGILGRMKNIIPTSALKILYDSLLMSHIQYGLEVWGGCNDSKGKKRLMGIQKKAIRHLTKAHFLSHTEPRMKSLGILKFDDQLTLQTAKLAHDIINKRCPLNLQNGLELCADQHSYSLRSGTNNPLDVRENRQNCMTRGIGFTKLGPKIWNEIPQELKALKGRENFKNKLKEHILKEYKDQVECNNPLCRDRKYHTQNV